MRIRLTKKVWLIFSVSILFGLGAKSEDQKKKKYEISEMPKALYLTAPESKDAILEFSPDTCPELKPKTNTAYAYLEMLVLAGERRSGSPAMRCAVKAVKETLEGFGYLVEIQDYRFPYYHIDSSLFELREKSTGKLYPSFPLLYSPATELELSGKVVRPEQIKKGEFVFVQSGFLGRKSLGEKAKEWQEKGAIGLVLDPKMFPFNTTGLLFPRSIHSTSWHYGALPGAVVQGAEELIGKEVVWKNKCQIYAGRGYNVIARTRGEFENYIIIGGHLDSWFQGALDDGSGVAVMMRIAELLKDEKPERTGFIFVAFDSEELGLFGSQYFYEKFGADKVKAMLNLDMVSVKNNFFYQEPEKAKIMPKVISTSPKLKELARQTYSDLKSAKLYTGFGFWQTVYGGLPTDYEWFYSAGIPGVFIYTPDRYYHTPMDNLTWQDADDLEAVAQASAELVKKMAEIKIPQPENSLEMEFKVSREEDGKIGLEVKLKKGEREIGLAKPKVFCYYEHGFEKKVELKKEKDKGFYGSFAPIYRGEYQLVAVAEWNQEVRKKVKSIWIEEPVKEEKKETKEAK